MDVKMLSESNLSEILDNAIDIAYTGESWRANFPKISGYRYFIPEFLHDMEEYPNSFRGDDHAIAHATVEYPELHPKIEKLTKLILIRNFLYEPFMSNTYEYAGTHYIVELALKDKKYTSLYADFLLSNEDERFQCFDFIRIVRQWGWCYETYYLLFVRFFLGKESFDDDMDYLNYSVSSLLDGHFEDEAERNVFFKAIQDYLISISFDSSDKDYNESLAVDFEKMVLKHISPRNRDFAKMMKIRYLEILNTLEEKEENSSESSEIITDNTSVQSISDELPEI